MRKIISTTRISSPLISYIFKKVFWSSKGCKDFDQCEKENGLAKYSGSFSL